MESSIFLHGKKYISARRGAEIAGYSGDYVGQLCREGKVEAERMGKIWFVSEESLLAHKREQELASLAMKERSQQRHETCSIKEVVTVSFAGYGFGDKRISTTHIPHTRPTAGYVEKVHALVAFGFVMLLVVNMAQLNPRRYVALVYDAVRDSLVSFGQSVSLAVSHLSDTDMPAQNSISQKNNVSHIYTALARDVYDLSAEKYVPDGRLIPSPQLLSFLHVADQLASAGLFFDTHGRVADTQKNEYKKVQLHFAENARLIFDRYTTFADNASRAFFGVGSAVGTFSDHHSESLQSYGIALSKKIEIASHELQMVGALSMHKVQTTGFQLQNFGSSLSQRVWIAGRELQMVGAFSLHQVQTTGSRLQSLGMSVSQTMHGVSRELQMVGVSLAYKVQRISFELQSFGNHLSQRMWLSGRELQAVGRHIGLAFEKVSNEFYNTGRLLAWISERTSGVAQDMGAELVVEIAVVREMSSLAISEMTPVVIGSIQNTQQTLLATVAETPITVVDGTARLGTTARENLTSIVARTYTYAQSLFVSDTYIAFMTRLFGVDPIKSTTVISDNDLEVPESVQSGVVVMKKGPAQSLETIKRQIQDSFSDEVSVEPDVTGTAGVIRPVFKKKVGEDYLYIMVPVQK